MIVVAQRASAILFSVLRDRADARPFLVPANVCPIVPETFRAAAQPFDLVDIAESDLAIDPAPCLERVRTHACAGILFVRPYGSERDPTQFFAELRQADPELLIIDDKCLSLPDCDGARITAFADVTLFSTGPGKFADLGHGGFAHAREDLGYRHASAGPDWLDLQAPIPSWNEYREQTREASFMAAAHKAALNEIYTAAIPDEVQLPSDFQQWRFNIRVNEPARLVESLFAAGLFASRHYPSLGDAPVAARLYAEVVNLFNDRNFTPEQAQRTTEIVVRHLSTGR